MVSATVQSIAQLELSHQNSLEFTRASVTVFSSDGHTNNSAPVPPVLVPAVTSAGVDFSTLPAIVVLALGVGVPVSDVSRCAVVLL